MHPTGAERSDTGTQPRPNLPYTQITTGSNNHQAKNKDTGNRDAGTKDIGKKLQVLAGDMMADLKNVSGNRAGLLDKEGRGPEVTGQGEDEAESEDGEDHKARNKDNGDNDGNTKDIGKRLQEMAGEMMAELKDANSSNGSKSSGKGDNHVVFRCVSVVSNQRR